MPRIKVLPVYPEYPKNTFWSYSHTVNLLGRKASMPPVGLLTAMALLPEDNFDIKPVVDMNTMELKEEDIRNTDLIMTSSMVVQGDSLEKVIARAHSLGKKVISGGPHPSSFYDKISADHFVLGEAEITLKPFVQDILSGNPLRKIYRMEESQTNVAVNKSGRPLLNETPIPRWDLINLKDYCSMAVQFSRGCPWSCDFCDITSLYGNESRTKNPQQMTKEFDALLSKGWKGPVFIVDDNFIGNHKSVRALLPVVESWQKKNNFPFALYTEASFDLASHGNKDILEGMVNSGFDMVFLGIESPDPDVLASMGKKQNRGDLVKKIKTIQNAGLEVTGGFIIGNDQDKPTTFTNMFDFIQETGVVTAMAGLLTAMRDTKLYERLKSEGRLREDSSGNNTHDLQFNFKPILDEKFLVDGYVNLLSQLYNSKNFYERCRVTSDNLGHAKAKHPLDWRTFKALGKILYENFIGNPDKEFIRYFAETAVKNPRKLSEVIAHSMKFYHLKKITEEVVKSRQ